MFCSLCPFLYPFLLGEGGSGRSVAIPGSPHRGQNWKIGKMTFLGSKNAFLGSPLEPFKWAFCKEGKSAINLSNFGKFCQI